jgi:hypothetical protein
MLADGKEDERGRFGLTMPRLYIVGRSLSDPCFGAIDGLELSRQPDGCDAAVVFTDGEGGSDLSTLTNSVERMHAALASIKLGRIGRLMVITDFGSLNGRRWKQTQSTWESNLGVSLDSVDGMGVLIVEILAKSAALQGVEVFVLRQGSHNTDILGPWIEKTALLSTAEYAAMQDPTIPDLDGWVVMNHDPNGEFRSAIDTLGWLT